MFLNVPASIVVYHCDAKLIFYMDHTYLKLEIVPWKQSPSYNIASAELINNTKATGYDVFGVIPKHLDECRWMQT